MRKVANEKPIEVLSAFAMIFAGVYLAGYGQPGTFMVVIGSLLSALGGALFSWATTSLSSKEAAADILRPQLSAIARQLVTVSGQISKAVYDARTEQMTDSVALEMVSQACRIMYASVNEIHVVLDQKVDPQELLETAQRVEELATKLAAKNDGKEDDEVETELMSAVFRLRSQLQEIASDEHNKRAKRSNKNIPKAAPHELEAAVVLCPSCQQEVSLMIGPAYGSSAMPTCTNCGTRFHAHRAQDGGVTGKLPGQKGR
ncbi:MAG: hypothetical protein AB7L09_26715 [Nitrospira sp.]